jgi:hypothetical protein
MPAPSLKSQLGLAILAVLLAAAPATAQAPLKAPPPLAKGVKLAEDLRAPDVKAFVVASDTPTYEAADVFSAEVGKLKSGERVEALARVSDWDWILVSKGGQGVGYAPTSMMIALPAAKPAKRR